MRRHIAGLPRARWQEAQHLPELRLSQAGVRTPQLARRSTELDAKHVSLRTVDDIDDPAEPRQRLLPPQPVTELEAAYAEVGDEVGGAGANQDETLRRGSSGSTVGRSIFRIYWLGFGERVIASSASSS